MPKNNVPSTEEVEAQPREQPFLYSWNRRIRHLHGISLRNLDISPPTGRARGKTITDEDYNLKTPTKSLMQDEYRTLQQSRSFDNLPSLGTFPTPQKSYTAHEHGLVPKRPAGRLRRRSTMHWGAANLQQRQQKLEDVALNRMVDTWFSIHHADLEDPVYISEVMEKSMNPSFSHFDLDKSNAIVTRSDHFAVKVWSRNAHMEEYRLLIDLEVNLRSLQFVGKTLDGFHHPLPENCVLFHLDDGIYTSFTDMPAEGIMEPQIRANQWGMSPTSISSYDALMKLANLDDCIQDALKTREKLEADINTLLAAAREDCHNPEEVHSQRESVSSTRHALSLQQKGVDELRTKNSTRRQSYEARRKAMDEAMQRREDLSEMPSFQQKEIQSVRAELAKTSELGTGQIRRICEDLMRIYPIEPIKNRTLQFTIRQIHLPNSVFDDTNRDEIAAALGFTAQLVYQLALYLSTPLPYPIEANGSSSFINDPVSVSLAQRQFPLHPTSVNYKFEYGVFLLNKDIEFLMNRSGLRVLDIRHTLPNLKYLLYLLTAGTGELPARKAGGFRGLLGGLVSPSLSRRGSEDSVQSQESVEHVNGNLVNSGKEKNGATADVAFGPGRVKGLPYRRSGLREAG